MIDRPEDRRSGERRLTPDRRFLVERRITERRQARTPVGREQRSGDDRRARGERRLGLERRVPLERRTPAGGAALEVQLRAALALLEQVADSDELGEERRRDLDAAVFRLRFALDRLEDVDSDS